MARVVVVGAGIGGLAAAARLATAGHDVVVCEQSDQVGGKLASYSRDGFTFDTGPSLLTLPAVYRDLFLKTGQPLEESVELVAVDPAFRYRFPDGTWLEVPNASRARTVAAMDAALGGGAGADWSRFLDRAHEIWQVTRGPFLESPLGGARDLVRHPAFAGLRPDRQLRADVERLHRHRRLSHPFDHLLEVIFDEVFFPEILRPEFPLHDLEQVGRDRLIDPV